MYNEQDSNLIKVFGLTKEFEGEEYTVKAVNNVTFTVRKGKTTGVVGESGCGKSTLGRTILLLYPPTGGKILFKGQNISALSGRQQRALRKKMQIIFQDPFSSLNPRWSAGKIIGSPLVIHRVAKGKLLREKVYDLLEWVGLKKEHYHHFPHEFSGGQAQRIGIARAIALNPDFIVADEPVSALDVSVQAQIISLLQKLQDDFNLTYLFISHDMTMVKHISHHILVMYLGKIVERADKTDLYKNPLHPYTRALLSAVPTLSSRGDSEQIMLSGEIPSQLELPPGCPFYSRCWVRKDLCRDIEPPDVEIEINHVVKCHLYQEK